jgi:hypothetical protein
MEMWDWLRPWWNWWSDLTDLFDWDAISALATTAAVLVALDQAGRASRVEARHGAGVFARLIAALEPIVHTVEVYGASEVGENAAKLIVERGYVRQALAMIAALDLRETAPLGIADYLEGIPQALHALEQELPAVAEGYVSSRWLDQQIWYLRSAVTDFRARQALLLHGRGYAALRSIWSTIQRKWFFRRL